MRKLFLTLFLVLGLYQRTLNRSNFFIVENSFQFLVYQRTIDGDTIKVDVANLQKFLVKIFPIRLRVLTHLKCVVNVKKKKNLRRNQKTFFIFNQRRRFTLHNLERDKFFRVVADVKLSDGRNCSDIMLFNNHRGI